MKNKNVKIGLVVGALFLILSSSIVLAGSPGAVRFKKITPDSGNNLDAEQKESDIPITPNENCHWICIPSINAYPVCELVCD